MRLEVGGVWSVECGERDESAQMYRRLPPFVSAGSCRRQDPSAERKFWANSATLSQPLYHRRIACYPLIFARCLVFKAGRVPRRV
jgi:hypothetical protein